jgi:hypothetical protein
MASKKGIIALMGSGELTATMVEVHKELLAGSSHPTKGVFLDTPAGFQLNVDQLSEGALKYFRTRVQQPIAVASYKSNELTEPYEAEQAFQTLRDSSFILIGPGSPTYAVRQWKQTPIPEIFVKVVESGGCLVAASAAALTVGRFTLPVYEIYKVGEDLHWVDGLNTLGSFGLDLVVVPHWNNAEGGTHDTRFCYMGEPRFRGLESLLPDDVSILGLDEHTACLIDLAREEAVVKGIGRVIVRRYENEMIFEKGDSFSLDLLRGKETGKGWKPVAKRVEPVVPTPEAEGQSFWDQIHNIELAFHLGLEKSDPKKATNALLEFDRVIWEAQKNLENTEFISQARDLMRELIVSLGIRLETTPKDIGNGLAPLVEEFLRLRESFRENGQWEEADAVREGLQRSNVFVEDTKEGPTWKLVV